MTALVSDRGERIVMAVDRWRTGADAVERAVLADVPDPVLDVGCGPGRIVAALAARGRPALGVDTSPAAVAEAGRRRAPVLRRSVFDALPGERRWGGVLLLDGNVGIGGDPVALLARAAGLLRTGGVALAELDPPGAPTRAMTVRVESASGRAGPWFPWARVGTDAFDDVARRAGLSPARVDAVGGRWFGWAARP